VPSNHPYIFFLGSHNALSRAEIEHVLTRNGFTANYEALSERLLQVKLSSPPPAVLAGLPDDFLEGLGGSDRIGLILASQETLFSAEDIWPLLSPTLGEKRKLSVGLSGVGVGAAHLEQLGNDLKKIAREANKSLRFITARGKGRLNAAQVMFNKLVHEGNSELTLIHDKNQFLLTRTMAVQDIAAYERRDTARPARDAQVGMLPPKLAQIMLNVAVFPQGDEKSPSVLDPFCGLGTVLQEGWLWGWTMTGSDSNPKMISATRENLNWAAHNFNSEQQKYPILFRHDVKNPYPPELKNSFSAVVTEPYLGPPLSSPLSEAARRQRIVELSQLYLSFFENIRPLLKDGGSVVCALPALRMKRGADQFDTMPQRFLDSIESLGYRKNQLFERREDSIYARPDALVGREITVWSKS
jgi:tRNA G10  N-methylase Trm11